MSPMSAAMPAVEPRRPAGHPGVRVVAWVDDLVDAAGLDPRSSYVERFWLPVLGPTATWLLRRLADGLTASPAGFDLDLDETARALGLGGVGSRHSPFQRAVVRCARYGIVRHLDANRLAVRRRMAPLPHHLILRLPLSLQDDHRRWRTSYAFADGVRDRPVGAIPPVVGGRVDPANDAAAARRPRGQVA